VNILELEYVIITPTMWVLHEYCQPSTVDRHWHYTKEEEAVAAFRDLCKTWIDHTDCSEDEFEEQIRAQYFTLGGGDYVLLKQLDSPGSNQRR
jgi:hypothetical protein